MDDVDHIDTMELELELHEREHHIHTLMQEVHELKLKLGDESTAPEAPPSPSSSGFTPKSEAAIALRQLRASLEEVTTERDALLQSLAELRSSHAALQARASDLEDDVAYATSAKDEAEKRAEEEGKGRKDAEETVVNLRSSVEEARRGVMRLQSEKGLGPNRRYSSIPAAGGAGDASVSGLGLDGLPAAPGSSPEGGVRVATSTRDKRASMGPPGSFSLAALNNANAVAGNGRSSNFHRRVSSISDSAVPFTAPDMSSLSVPPVTNKAGLRELRLSQAPSSFTPPTPAVTSSISSFLGFGGSAPTTSSAGATPSPSADARTLSFGTGVIDLGDDDASDDGNGRLAAMAKLEGRTPAAGPSSAEFAQLRSQVSALEAELAAAREARLASENACRALREFIASSSAGPSSSSLAPQLSAESTAPSSGAGETLKLPPLPSDIDIDDDEAAESTANRKRSESQPSTGLRSWSLWKTSSKVSTPPVSTPAPPTTSSPTPGLLSPNLNNSNEEHGSPGSSFVASWTRTVSREGVTPDGTPASNRSKFSFFGSKSPATSVAAETVGERDEDESEAPTPPVKEVSLPLLTPPVKEASLPPTPTPLGREVEIGEAEEAPGPTASTKAIQTGADQGEERQAKAQSSAGEDAEEEELNEEEIKAVDAEAERKGDESSEAAKELRTDDRT